MKKTKESTANMATRVNAPKLLEQTIVQPDEKDGRCKSLDELIGCDEGVCLYGMLMRRVDNVLT